MFGHGFQEYSESNQLLGSDLTIYFIIPIMEKLKGRFFLPVRIVFAILWQISGRSSVCSPNLETMVF